MHLPCPLCLPWLVPLCLFPCRLPWVPLGLLNLHGSQPDLLEPWY